MTGLGRWVRKRPDGLGFPFSRRPNSQRHFAVTAGWHTKPEPEHDLPEPDLNLTESDPDLHKARRIREADPRRWLLRALLRETTYLPDPASRQYLRRHILSRYRAYLHGEKFEKWYDEAKLARQESSSITALKGRDGAMSGHMQQSVLDTDKRHAALQVQARKALYQLQRANEGFPHQLMRTLLLTYGRTGKRRSDLLQPLLRPDPDEKIITDPLRESVKARLHEANLEKIPRLPAALVALLRSQNRVNMDKIAPHAAERIKSIELDLPDTNSFKRALPQKRALNLVKAHYASLLDQVMPPVSTEEWDRLAVLASRETTENEWQSRGVRLDRDRRKRANSAKRGKDESGANIQAELALKAHHQPWRGAMLASAGKERPHVLTKRWMRRLYAIVFRMTPKMEWYPAKQKWGVRWGTIKIHSKDDELIQVMETEMATAFVKAVKDEPKDRKKRKHSIPRAIARK